MVNNIQDWTKLTDEFNLPRWAKLPDIELYMDQIVSQLCKYLAPININEGDAPITASMVNNYVKQQLLPPPVKKKYSRIHLAHLVVICLLKQVLSIQDVKTLIDDMFENLSEDEIERVYDDFCLAQENAFKNTVKVLNEEKNLKEDKLAMQAGVAAFASKTMAQMMLNKPL